MGLISDFYIVDPAEISTRFPGWVQPGPDWFPDGEASEVEVDDLETLEMNGITVVMLDALLRPLGEGCAVSAEYIAGTGEQLLSVLSARAVEALAALQGAQRDQWIDAVVSSWREDLATIPSPESRDLELARCTRDAWAPALRELTAFAERCEAPQVLVMFTSL